MRWRDRHKPGNHFHRYEEDLDHQAHMNAWWLLGFTVFFLALVTFIAVEAARKNQVARPAVKTEKAARP